jgi:hypothetical protein
MIAFPGVLILVMPGLDPGIHQNKNEDIHDQRWIAGSSPAITRGAQAK